MFKSIIPKWIDLLVFQRHLKSQIQQWLLLSTMLFLSFSNAIYCQTDTTIDDHYRKNLNLAEVDFIYSYYQQDGNHAAVTGGLGTEHLTDNVGQIAVMIPYGAHKFKFQGGLDHYTSASSDKIDPATISSASSLDDRGYFNISWDKEQDRISFGFNTGFSVEYDVSSVSFGGNISFSDKYKNHQLSLSGQYFRDRWSLIYPIELRRKPGLNGGSDVRNIVDVSAMYSAVINQRMQVALVAQVVNQSGLLATPFHRVYFQDIETPDIERLPRQRWKYPVSGRLHYYINEWLVVRSMYRFYNDDFGITAHTMNLELPLKINDKWTLVPFARYHDQSAATYFAAHGEHISTEEFYTSDYDLSAFSSQKYGLGISCSPLDGLWQKKMEVWKVHGVQLKNFELRGGVYNRSDGLNAFIGTLGFKFVIY